MTTMTKLRIAILSKLSAGDMSTREIAAACDRTTTEIATVMLRAIKAGYVEVVGRSESTRTGPKPFIYAITEAGRKAVAGVAQ